MVKFDILEMNKDGTSINLKVSIIDNSYTNNVYIKSLIERVYYEFINNLRKE